MVDYHLMNIVKVKVLRYHDRVILPRVDKFKMGGNIITTEDKNYPSKYFMDSKTADTYPQERKNGSFGPYQVYVIPVDDLLTIQEHEAGKQSQNQEIIDNVKRIFG